MYNSPINILLSDIQYEILKEQEENLVKAVQNYGIDINRDELIKALNYDRNQYRIGYKEGMLDFVNKLFDIVNSRINSEKNLDMSLSLTEITDTLNKIVDELEK